MAQTTDGSGVQPAFEAEQEIRFAVVMYGGVSLAIYINGVAQELFRLIRATAPSRKLAEVPTRVWFTTSGGPAQSRLSATERIYRQLGQALPLHSDQDPIPPADDAPVRTRFVVDILSGSSAGGINAIFLAKALANQQDFDQLRDLWIKEAEIEVLLRDEQSWDGLQMTQPEPPPQSLLNGHRLYAKALETLTKMRDTEQAPRASFDRPTSKNWTWRSPRPI